MGWRAEPREGKEKNHGKEKERHHGKGSTMIQIINYTTLYLSYSTVQDYCSDWDPKTFFTAAL